MSISVPLTAGTLPAGYCPVSYQDLYNEMFSNGYGTLPAGSSPIWVGNTAPNPTVYSAWIQTQVSGAPVYPAVWVYVSGAWVALHPLAPSGPDRRLFMGSSTDILTYDGGTSGSVTATSGPMWQIDSSFAGCVLGAPGAITGTSPAISINPPVGGALGTVVGSGGGTLAMNNLPAAMPLTHGTNQWQTGTSNYTYFLWGISGPPFAEATSNPQVLNFTNPGGGVPYPVVQPTAGIYVIQRTARLYYTNPIT